MGANPNANAICRVMSHFTTLNLIKEPINDDLGSFLLTIYNRKTIQRAQNLILIPGPTTFTQTVIATIHMLRIIPILCSASIVIIRDTRKLACVTIYEVYNCIWLAINF